MLEVSLDAVGQSTSTLKKHTFAKLFIVCSLKYMHVHAEITNGNGLTFLRIHTCTCMHLI